jgi:hypothetical protein
VGSAENGASSFDKDVPAAKAADDRKKVLKSLEKFDGA